MRLIHIDYTCVDLNNASFEDVVGGSVMFQSCSIKVLNIKVNTTETTT